MGEGIRNDPALTLLLQTVVADGVRRVQCFLKIPFLEPVMTLLGVVGPDPGKAIRLQLLANQQAVVTLHTRAALTGSLHLLRYAQQRLHMVADLMGDHVGLSEVARDRKARGHLIEELQVEIHLLVARTVEGADCRIGEATG